MSTIDALQTLSILLIGIGLVGHLLVHLFQLLLMSDDSFERRIKRILADIGERRP